MVGIIVSLRRVKTLAHTIGIVLAMYTALVFTFLLYASTWPRTALGWALVITLGLVMLLIGDAVVRLTLRGAAWAGLGHLHAWAERRTAGRDISWLRITLLVGEVLLFVGLVAGVWGLLSRQYPALAVSTEKADRFIQQHFR